jgi:gliding motility-associated lipoprotein GldH
MIKRKTKIATLLLFSLFAFASCDSNRIYDENFEVGDDGWDNEDIKTFEIDISDTISALDLYINFRTTSDYPYSNIYLFLHSEYPDGYTDKDTIEYILAAPDGEWYGESTGTVVENKMLISRGGRFATAGKYIFKVEHAMREDVLPEVLDVGFTVQLMEIEE